MELLLSYNVDTQKIAFGTTPLVLAASDGYGEFVEILASRPDCSREDRVDALELLGAAYIDIDEDPFKAMAIWEEAMIERHRDAGSVLCKAERVDGPVEAYDGAVEVKTLDELRRLNGDYDRMWMQALLIRERVLGVLHPETTCYIRKRGYSYSERGNFNLCAMLYMHALDMRQRHLRHLKRLTQESFLAFVRLFIDATGSGHEDGDAITYTVTSSALFSCVMDVFDRAIVELERGMADVLESSRAETMTEEEEKEKDFEVFDLHLVILLQLIAVVCHSSNDLSNDEAHRFKKIIRDVIQMDPRGCKGYTLLHLACSCKASYVNHIRLLSFPDPAVVTTLVEACAPLNAVDYKMNTPLHVIAMACHTNHRSEIANVLLSNGAHLDACNSRRCTAMQLLHDDEMFDISPVQYISLQCLAAKVIVERGIPYRDQVPPCIQRFISIH